MRTKAYKTYLRKALFALLGAAVLQGCTREEYNGVQSGDGEVVVRLEVSVEGGAGVTRGMTDDQETTITTIDVYHFVRKPGTTGDDYANYQGMSISPAQGTFTEGPPSWVNATLNTYPGQDSRLVVVVNARDDYGYQRTMTLKDFTDALIVEETGEWYTGTSRPLPMYAVTGNVEVKKDAPDITDNGEPFPLLRMHAKFTVSLKGPLDEGVFELVSVCVFNRKTQGFLPYVGPLDYTDGSDKPKVTAPNIPSTAGNVYEPDEPYYGVGTDDQKPDYGMIVNKQYVFEVNNADESDRLEKTALVIGGKYGTDTEVTYYRVDIPDDVTGGNILRNRNYDVEIQWVKNSGYDTAEEAFIGSKQIEYTVTVVPWGENVKVELPFKLPDVPDGGTPLSEKTYVGAFWRADQTGERLIRIPVAAAGRWAVQVYEYGAGFGKGDIVFSTEASNDTNIGTDAAADMIANDAAYQVGGNSIYAMGNTAKESGQDYIFFRIGLKSTWTPWPTQPVRYATALISYTPNGGTTIYQKLFLRQGEDADYLMAPDDAGIEIPAITGRPYAKPFLPYNLTTPNSDKITNDPYYDNTLSTNGGKLTSYPSQAGAFWQFTSPNKRYAYNPIVTSLSSGWNSYNLTEWKADQETCPPDYRRPVGNTDSGANEFYQSLVSDEISTAGNSVWGFYADGYFDRYDIGDPPGINYTVPGTAVNVSSVDIAYIGRLFYNPLAASDNYNASVFFPAAGYRNGASSSGMLYYTGHDGYYWSSAQFTSTDHARLLYVDESNVYPSFSYYRSSGFSIRCVKDDSWTPAPATPALTTDSDGRKISADGGTYTIQVTSNTEWVATVKRGTNTVTTGDAGMIGRPLLDEATGFDGGQTNATVTGSGNETLTVTTADYTALGKFLEGDFVIVFRDKATGEILGRTTITAGVGGA